MRAILSILGLCVFISCSKPSSGELNKLNEVVKSGKSFELANKIYCIVVPSDNGCPGCLKLVKRLIEQHKNDQSLLFIVSGYSTKGMKQYLAKEFRNSNILKDSAALAVKAGLVNEYPVLYDLAENEEAPFKRNITMSNIDSIKFILSNKN